MDRLTPPLLNDSVRSKLTDEERVYIHWLDGIFEKRQISIIGLQMLLHNAKPEDEGWRQLLAMYARDIMELEKEESPNGVPGSLRYLHSEVIVALHTQAKGARLLYDWGSSGRLLSIAEGETAGGYLKQADESLALMRRQIAQYQEEAKLR